MIVRNSKGRILHGPSTSTMLDRLERFCEREYPDDLSWRNHVRDLRKWEAQGDDIGFALIRLGALIGRRGDTKRLFSQIAKRDRKPIAEDELRAQFDAYVERYGSARGAPGALALHFHVTEKTITSRLKRYGITE